MSLLSNRLGFLVIITQDVFHVTRTAVDHRTPKLEEQVDVSIFSYDDHYRRGNYLKDSTAECKIIGIPRIHNLQAN